jgi:hypothetical protein
MLLICLLWMNIINADRNVLGKPNPIAWIRLDYTFGHYISSTTDMEITEPHHRTVAPILHISAYSSVRWQQGIDVMMKEKKGDFLVTNLLHDKKLRRVSHMMYTAKRFKLVAK